MKTHYPLHAGDGGRISARQGQVLKPASGSRDGGADKAMTSMYALAGPAFQGSQNIRTMAIIQLLLGNIGVAGAA